MKFTPSAGVALIGDNPAVNFTVLQQDSRTWWKEGQDDGDEDA
jgi:hypothetical protein